MKIFDVHLAFNTSYYSSVEMAKVSFFLPQISAEQRAPSQEVFQDPFREILDESIPSDLEGV